MSWGLGWKRSFDIFHLSLYYGTDEAVDDPSPSSSSRSSSSSSISSSHDQPPELGFRIYLDWNAGDDEDQTALRLQSQVMVALPLPQDTVTLELITDSLVDDEAKIGVDMKVVKRREPLRALILSRVGASGQQSEGIGVLTRLLRYNFDSGSSGFGLGSGSGSGSGSDSDSSPTRVVVCADHWKTVTAVSLCGCGLSVSVSLYIHVYHQYMDECFGAFVAFLF